MARKLGSDDIYFGAFYAINFKVTTQPGYFFVQNKDRIFF